MKIRHNMSTRGISIGPGTINPGRYKAMGLIIRAKRLNNKVTGTPYSKYLAHVYLTELKVLVLRSSYPTRRLGYKY